MKFSDRVELEMASEDVQDFVLGGDSSFENDAEVIALVAQNGDRTEIEAIALLSRAAFVLASQSTANAVVGIAANEAYNHQLTSLVAESYAEAIADGIVQQLGFAG